jgi:hypothetical protein
MSTLLPFQSIAPHLSVGSPVPLGRQPLAAVPLLVLVGVTGVGKSTLLGELMGVRSDYQLLPDRRSLTDQLIIAQMQAEAGAPIGSVTDRGQRFAYTRRYRTQFPGGMAHALTQLWLADDAPARRWIFDGLRGDNEVRYAADALPRARFVMLDAPDLVRVQRLLGRGDAFDTIALEQPTHTTPPTEAPSDLTSFDDLDLAEARNIFSPAEEQILLSWVRRGAVPPVELRAKLQIVIEERRNYDPNTTMDALQQHAADRMLYIDTVTHAPSAVAAQVLSWLATAEEG